MTFVKYIHVRYNIVYIHLLTVGKVPRKRPATMPTFILTNMQDSVNWDRGERFIVHQDFQSYAYTHFDVWVVYVVTLKNLP